jgi:hypothetical protein
LEGCSVSALNQGTKVQEEKCLSSTRKAENETKRVKEEKGEEIGK